MLFKSGSGLPEFKHIVSGGMKPSDRRGLVSFRILVAKVIGLILATGSGLSIGTEGPVILIAACITHLLIDGITVFSCIKESPTLSRQMFAASAAVGIGSAFNAPLGGLLFSIELTSTYYLVTNYAKSFVAATAGTFVCSVFFLTQKNYAGSPRTKNTFIEMTFGPENGPPFQKWELVIYGLIGILFSWVAIMFLKLNQNVHIMMGPYCKKHPLLTCAIVAGITALVIYFTGAYTSNSVRVFSLAGDVLTDGYLAEMRKFEYIPPLVGLIVSFIARTFITLIACNSPIPSGYFAPTFLIGTILGRFVGVVVLYAGHKAAYLPGYALVGGCALASGVTQRISIAIIAVELTGNFAMLLPCLIASVIGASMTKPHIMSVYDNSMKNKGLESFQLLLRESLHNFTNAADVMSLGSDMAYIPQNCSALYLLQIIDTNLETQFPVVESLNSLKLLGTVDRSGLFEYLWLIFHEWNMDDLLVILLPADSEDHKNRLADTQIKNGIQKIRERFSDFLSIRTRLLGVSMNITDEVHCPEGKNKSSEDIDREESLKARIRLLLGKDGDTESKCNDDDVIEEINTVLNMGECFDRNITPGDFSDSNLHDRLDASETDIFHENKGTTLSSESRDSILIGREDSVNIDNDSETFSRSIGMTVVNMVGTELNKASQFLSHLPETSSQLKAKIPERQKTASIEDELQAFKLRPITRRSLRTIDNSEDNSLSGGKVGDDNPKVKEWMFLAIKKVVKQRLREETLNSVSTAPVINSISHIEIETHDDCKATTVPRAVSYVNDTDIKNAFRERLDKNEDILNCPRFPRVSAFPFRCGNLFFLLYKGLFSLEYPLIFEHHGKKRYVCLCPF
jgi:H+/Cl- antiporter ClcA